MRLILLGVVGIVINCLPALIIDVIMLRFPLPGRLAQAAYNTRNILIIMTALLLFTGIKNVNIHSKMINALASATLGVYLIHDNNFVRPFLWQKVFHNASFQDSKYLIPYSLAVITIVYISCSVIELVRIKIFRVISRGRLS